MSDLGEDIADTPGEDTQKKAEKLYGRLEKIMARLRESTSEPELLISLRHVFSSMRKINEFEESQLQPGETYEPLTFERIYHLASSGNGGSTTAALQEANAAFAEENKILVETIESLTFQLDVLKRQSADEILGRGDEKVVTLKDLKGTISSLNKTMENVERVYGKLSPASPSENGEQKPLDERFAEAIGNFEKISPDLLKVTPNSTTRIGKMLRKYGFAYDYKDIATVHHLVQTLLKTNHKLVDINRTLLPSQEQMEYLRQALHTAELYAGHEGRQQPQYIEAMAEIDRLRTRLDRYEQTVGEIARLEQKSAELDANIARKEERIESLTISLRNLQDDVDLMSNRRADQLNKNPADVLAQDYGHSTKQAFADFLRNKSKPVVDLNIDDLLDEQKEALDTASKIVELKNKVIKLTKNLEDLQTLSSQQQWELLAAKQRLSESESGMLVRKLEFEIEALRREAVELEEKLLAEAADRVTLEERINIWIEKEEDLQKDIAKWQKVAGIKSSFMITATGVAAVGGLYASQAGLIHATMTSYMMLMVTAPAIFMGCISAVKRGAKDAVKGAALGGLLGVFSASIGYGVIALEENKARETVEKAQAQNRWLLQSCSYTPCHITRDKDGNLTIFEPEYKSKRTPTRDMDYSTPHRK